MTQRKRLAYSLAAAAVIFNSMSSHGILHDSPGNHALAFLILTLAFVLMVLEHPE